MMEGEPRAKKGMFYPDLHCQMVTWGLTSSLTQETMVVTECELTFAWHLHFERLLLCPILT